VTPFGAWSYDLTEEQAAELLTNCPKGWVHAGQPLTPKGAIDVSSRGRSVGSVTVRDAVLRLGSRLAVCDHIHACARRHALLGRSPVVNAGPEGVEWEL
jgi:Icc-related predicted phosphoesterase